MTNVDFENIFIKNVTFFSLEKNLSKRFLNNFKSNFEISKDGNPTFRINNRYLYSKYYPCDKFKKLDFKDNKLLLFLENGIGLSFYYFINEKRKINKDENKSITIVFTSLLSFLFSLFIIDFSNIETDLIFIVIYTVKHNNINNEIKYIHDIINKNQLKEKIVKINKQIMLNIIESFDEFENYIQKYCIDNLITIADYNKFKFYFESPIFNSNEELDISFINIDIAQKLLKIIDTQIQKNYKSLMTEKFFSNIWQKNIDKNLKILKEKKWEINELPFKLKLKEKKGIIFWGASPLLDNFLNKLSDQDVLIINKYYYSISITSSTEILLEKKINIDYQALFDAGLFGYFNIENYSVPFIISMIIHPAIMKKIINKPFLVNLLTEEEKEIPFIKLLPDFPFYGATLPTIYKKFNEYFTNEKLNSESVNLFLIASDFNMGESKTHHKRYPLYKYILSKSKYTSPLLNWESNQKIINLKKFTVYQNSLKNLKIFSEKELKAELNILRNSF